MKRRNSKSKSFIHFDEAVRNKHMRMKPGIVYLLELSIDNLNEDDKNQIINIIRNSTKIIPDLSSVIAPKFTDNYTHFYVHDARRSVMNYYDIPYKNKLNAYKVNNVIHGHPINIIEINSSNDAIEKLGRDKALFFVKYFV